MPSISSANEVLREVFLERKRRNPSYSTRALARDLSVSQTYISLLLAGKKRVPHGTALRFAELLRLDPRRRERLLESCAGATGRTSRVETSPENVLELESFRIISDWYHLAILDLSTTSGFRAEPSRVARRLGISAIQARDALDRLARMGLLRKSGSTWKKTDRVISVPSDRSHPAIRMHHEQMIHKALEELKDARTEAYSRREISSATIAANPRRIDEARKRIRGFLRETVQFLAEGECTEVFQLNCQFFQLTRMEKRK